jgi:hypothetical protein
MAPLPGPASLSLRIDNAPFVRRSKVNAYATPDPVVKAAIVYSTLSKDDAGAIIVSRGLRSPEDTSRTLIS